MKFLITVKGGEVDIDYPERWYSTELTTLYSGAARKICDAICDTAEIFNGDIDEINDEFLSGRKS